MDEQNLGDKLKNDRLVLTKRDANSANEFTTPVTFPLFRPLMLDVPESEAESESQERHPKQNDVTLLQIVCKRFIIFYKKKLIFLIFWRHFYVCSVPNSVQKKEKRAS